MSSKIDRRWFVAALALAPLGGCVGEAAKPAPRVARFREVRVDASPFAAKGVSNYAARVADRLRLAVTEAFAGRIAAGEAGAPVLVIEVSTVRLASYVGGGSSGRFDRLSGDADDTMTGALVLTSAKGATIDRRSHYVTSDAAISGDWRLPDNEDRRLDALCRLYAEWAVREFE